MADRRLIDERLTKAEEDFAFARVNLEERKPFFAQICFHFHQAAEKYLKAFIVARNLSFLKTHDLPMLVKNCTAADPAVDQLRDACAYLAAFYVETRYPVHWPTHYSLAEAERACEATEQVRNWVTRRLA